MSCLQTQGFPQLSSGLIIHWNDSQNSGKHSARDNSLNAAAGYKLEAARGRVRGAQRGWLPEDKLPLSSGTCSLPSIREWLSMQSIAKPKIHPKLWALRLFMEAPWHEYGWLDYCPLVWTQISSPPLEGGRYHVTPKPSLPVTPMAGLSHAAAPTLRFSP